MWTFSLNTTCHTMTTTTMIYHEYVTSIEEESRSTSFFYPRMFSLIGGGLWIIFKATTYTYECIFNIVYPQKPVSRQKKKIYIYI